MTLRFASILALAILSGCSDGSGVDWRAIGQASCSLSMHCNPSEYAAGGSGYSNANDGMGSAQATAQYKSAITVSGTKLCPLDARLGQLSHEQRSGMNKICFYN